MVQVHPTHMCTSYLASMKTGRSFDSNSSCCRVSTGNGNMTWECMHVPQTTTQHGVNTPPVQVCHLQILWVTPACFPSRSMNRGCRYKQRRYVHKPVHVPYKWADESWSQGLLAVDHYFGHVQTVHLSAITQGPSPPWLHTEYRRAKGLRSYKNQSWEAICAANCIRTTLYKTMYANS